MEATHSMVRRSRRGVRLAAAGVALALTFSACGATGDGDESSTELPKDLNVLVPFVSPLFDQYATATSSLGSILLVNEPLVRYEGDGVFENVLADKVEQPSPTEYVYTLRPDVTFSDGTPLTPDDVKFSFDKLTADDSTAQNAVLFAGVETVETRGDDKVVFTLSAPDPQLVYGIAQTGIVSKAFYEENGDQVGTPGVGQVGTGPYTLASFDPAKEVVLDANPDYWGDAASFDSITTSAAEDDSARLLALQSGEVDGIFEMPIVQLDAVKSLDTYDVTETPDATLYSVAFDVTKKPFDDLLVRQAVQHALNRDAIIEAVFAGQATLANSLTPESVLGVVADPDDVAAAYEGFGEDYTYDVEEAKSLLAESSVPDGFEFELPVQSADANMSLVAQTVVQDLAAIGITAELKPMDDQNYFATVILAHDNGGMNVSSTGTITPDPANLLGFLLKSTGVLNFSQWNSPEFDDLLAKSNEYPTTDPERGELLLQALTVNHEANTNLPLAFPKMFFGVKSGLALEGFTSYWWMARWDEAVQAS